MDSERISSGHVFCSTIQQRSPTPRRQLKSPKILSFRLRAEEGEAIKPNHRNHIYGPLYSYIIIRTIRYRKQRLFHAGQTRNPAYRVSDCIVYIPGTPEVIRIEKGAR